MKDKLPFLKNRLFSPGPTPVPLQSMLLPLGQTPYHRTGEFYSTFLRCRESLAPVFGSKSLPLILTCSGTGAMEAAVTNFTEAGDKVLCLVGGKFGERWQEIAQAYQCQSLEFSFPWGSSPNLEELARVLKTQKGLKAVFLQANETSTGVALPLEQIAAVIRESAPDTLIVVDAISSLCAHPMSMDKWGLDVVLSASQKGFGVPPGLAFLAYSERARSRLSQRPRFYFDLRAEEKGQSEGQSAFTPATTLILSLAASLDTIHATGLEKMITYHAKVGEAVRRALVKVGFALFPASHWSNAVTAVTLPAGVEYSALSKILREQYAETFSGGQGALKGRILRFAHLGLFDYFDVLAGIAAIEQALADLRGPRAAELGAGAATFMQTFANPPGC